MKEGVLFFIPQDMGVAIRGGIYYGIFELGGHEGSQVVPRRRV